VKSAIILVDVQNDYFPGGANPLHEPEQAVGRASRVLQFARQQSWPVCHVQHISTKPGASVFLPESHGAAIHEQVAPIVGEKVYVKHVPNAFHQTGLAEDLREQQIDHLVICGMMSHMCIDTTVRAARDLGFSVTLLQDACTTKNLTWEGTVIPARTVHNTFMASLSGSFAYVIPTSRFLATNA